MVFFENDPKAFKPLINGDVFTDSVIKDVFIPFKFKAGVIGKDIILKAIFSKDKHNVSFIHLIRDCNGMERKSAIEYDCTTILLNNNVDGYLSNKIFVQPVEIEFLETNISPGYYSIYKNKELLFKNTKTMLDFRSGAYEILRVNVLEYNW